MLSWEGKDHYHHYLSHSIPPTSSVQPVDKGQPTHPIPKPRIGQGRAGLRRKFKTNQPIPLSKQNCCSTNNNTCSKGSTVIA